MGRYRVASPGAGLATRGGPSVLRAALCAACTALLLAGPADGAWIFSVLNADLVSSGSSLSYETPQGLVTEGRLFSSGADEAVPSLIYFTPSGASACDSSNTNRVFELLNPTAVDQAINLDAPLTSGYTVDTTYVVCYVQDTTHLQAGAGEFKVVGANPSSAVATGWRSGRDAASLVITAAAGQSLGRGTVNPLLQRCDEVMGCGNPFDGALLCKTDPTTLIPSTAWSEVQVTSTAVTLAASVPLLSAGSYRICYSYDSGDHVSWRQLGDFLTIEAPEPAFYYINPTPAVVGWRRQDSMQLFIAASLSGGARVISEVSLVSNTSGSCAADGTSFEAISPVASVDKSMHPGIPAEAASLEVSSATLRVTDESIVAVALCVTLTDSVGGANPSISRVPLYAQPLGLTMLEANPSACPTTPAIPRLGQHVTIGFTVSDPLAGDLASKVFFETSGGLCERAQLAPGVSVVSSTSTDITVKFGSVGTFVVCYDASDATTTKVCSIPVAGAVPTEASLNPSLPIALSNVTVSFENIVDGTVLNLEGGDTPAPYDEARFIPVTEQCAAPAVASPDVIVHHSGPASLSAVFTKSGCYKTCYRLAGGVWADVPSAVQPDPAALSRCDAASLVGAVNVVFIYPSTPQNYTVVTSLTNPDGSVRLEGKSTFRIDFNEPALMPRQPDSSDKYAVRPYSGVEADLTDVVLSTLCSDPTLFVVEGSVVDVSGEDRREATLHLDAGSFVVCYTLSGYTSAPLVATNTNGYLISVVENPVRLVSTTPVAEQLRARQIFFITLNVDAEMGLTEEVLVYSPGERYCDLAGVGSGGQCRCPSLSESRTKVSEPEVIPADSRRWRVLALAKGSYLLCHRYATLLTVLSIADPLPLMAGLSAVPRQGRPLTITFSNSSKLVPAAEVRILTGAACDCTLIPRVECSLATPALRTSGDPRQVSVPGGLPRGSYSLCYYNGDDSRSQTRVYTGEGGVDPSFSVAQADPSRASFSFPPSVGRLITVTLTMFAEFQTGDAIRFLPEGSDCLTGLDGGVNASDPDGFAIYSAAPVREKTFSVEFLKQGSFVVCHRRQGEAFWVLIPDPASFPVLSREPHSLVTAPTGAMNPSVGQSADLTFNCSRDGLGACSRRDHVVVISADASCDDVLLTPLGDLIAESAGLPGDGTAMTYSAAEKVYWNNRTSLSIDGSLATVYVEEVYNLAADPLSPPPSLQVCYRSAADLSAEDGQFWRRVDQFPVAPMNPSAFEVIPAAPTVAEFDVTLTFTGTGLGGADGFFFTHHKVPCHAYALSEVQPLLSQKKVFEGVQPDGRFIWRLLAQGTDVVFNPSVPTEYRAITAGEMDSEPYLRRVCYFREGTRLSPVGADASFNGFFPASPGAFSVSPSTCPVCPFFVVQANATVRLSFSSDTLPLTGLDTVKFVPYQSPCREDEPASPEDQYHFPLLKPLAPDQCTAGCTLILPVTFTQTGVHTVCYKHQGRTFSAMPKGINVGSAEVAGFSYLDEASQSLGAAESAGVLPGGSEVSVIPSPMGFLQQGMSGYLVDRGEPCIVNPAPTNPARRDPLPFHFQTADAADLLPNATSGEAYGFSAFLRMPELPSMGSYDLCLLHTTETHIGTGIEVGPTSPSSFAVADPGNPGAVYLSLDLLPAGGDAGATATIALRASPSALPGILPLSHEDDTAVVTSHSSCAGLTALREKGTFYYSEPLPLRASSGASGGVDALWTLNTSLPQDASLLASLRASEGGSVTLCYRREGGGGGGSAAPPTFSAAGYAPVPVVLVPVLLCGFGSAEEVASSLGAASGFSLETHANLTGLGQYALVPNASEARVEFSAGLPPLSNLAVTMWVDFADLPESPTLLNVIDVAGVFSLRLLSGNRLALFTSATPAPPAPVGEPGGAIPRGEWCFLQLLITRSATPGGERSGSAEIRINSQLYAVYTTEANGLSIPLLNDSAVGATDPPSVRIFGEVGGGAEADLSIAQVARLDDVRVFTSEVSRDSLVAQMLYQTDLPLVEGDTPVGFVHRGPVSPGHNRIIFKQAASMDPPGDLRVGGRATFTFRAVLHGGVMSELRAKSYLSAEDSAFLIPGDRACAEVWQARDSAAMSNMVFTKTEGNVVSEFSLDSATRLGPAKACYLHRFTEGLAEFTGLEVMPASPSGVTFGAPLTPPQPTEALPYFFSGQQAVAVFLEEAGDAPLNPTLDEVMFSDTSAGCSAGTPSDGTQPRAASTRLRAPRWGGGVGGSENRTFWLCYRRMSPEGHPLHARWAPIPGGSVVVLPQHPVGFTTAPAYPAEGMGVSTTPFLQAGFSGQSLRFSGPRPHTLDRVLFMLTSAADLQGDSPLRDPCMFLRPANSTERVFLENPSFPVLKEALIPGISAADVGDIIEFSVDVPLVPPTGSPEALRVCYRAHDPAEAEGGLWGSLSGGVSLIPPDPAGYTANPPKPFVGQGVNLTLPLSREPGLDVDNTTRKLQLVPLGSACGGSAHAFHPLAFADTSLQATGVPTGAAGSYTLCYSESRGGVTLTRPFEDPIEVLPPNPSSRDVSPPFPQETDDIKVTYKGVASGGLSAAGAAKLVPIVEGESADCNSEGVVAVSLQLAAEQPVPMEPGSPDIAVEALFSAAGVRAVYMVCFRLEGATHFAKTPGDNVAVGKNPWQYRIVSGVSENGALSVKQWGSIQGAMELDGTDFGTTDTVHLAAQVECNDPSALTIPMTLVSSSLARVDLPLDLSRVYKVCYQRNGFFTDVTPALWVFEAPIMEGAVTAGTIRANELIEVMLSGVAEVANVTTKFYVSAPDMVGKLTNENGKSDLAYAKLLRRERISGKTWITYSMAFASAGQFILFVDDAAAKNPVLQRPKIFTVTPTQPSGFLPQSARVGQELKISLVDPPAAVEAHSLMIGTTPFCQTPCPQELCSSQGGGDEFTTADIIQIHAVPPQDLFVCYKRSGGGWMQLGGTLKVLPSPVESAVSCPVSAPPASVVHWGHNLSLSITFRSEEFTPSLSQHAYRAFLTLSSAGAVCADNPPQAQPNPKGFSEFLTIAEDNTTGVVFFPLYNRDTLFPSEALFSVCLLDVVDNVFYNISGSVDGATFLLQVGESHNPAGITPNPATLRQGQVGGTFALSPTGITEVFIAAGKDRYACMESCTASTPVADGIRSGSVLGVKAEGGTVYLTQDVPLQAPLPALGDFVVCYATPATSGVLSYLGGIAVAENDPATFTVLPIGPRGGESITVTLLGASAAAQTKSLLVPSAMECGADSYSPLTPPGHAVISHATRLPNGVFTFATKQSLDPIDYKVCVSDGSIWTQVGYTAATPLTILKSEPAEVLVDGEGSLREGVPANITVGGVSGGSGDRFVITTAGGACGITTTPACDACTAPITTSVPALQGVPLTAGKFEMCYQRAGGTFAKVFSQTPATGGPPRLLLEPRVITVSPANPSKFLITPSHVEAGMRFTATLTGEGPLASPGNEAKLIKPGSASHPTTSIPIGVCSAAGSEVIHSWDGSDGTEGPVGSGTASFEGWVPLSFYSRSSDGDPTGGASDLLFYAVLCFRFSGQSWVAVPAYPSDPSGLVAVHIPDPYALTLSPLPARGNVLNLEAILSFSAGVAPASGDSIELREGRCGDPAVTPLFTSQYAGGGTAANDWALSAGVARIPVGSLQGVDSQNIAVCFASGVGGSLQTLPTNVSITAARPVFFRIAAVSGGAAVSLPRAGRRLNVFFSEGESPSDTAVFIRVGSATTPPTVYPRLTLESLCRDAAVEPGVLRATSGGGGVEADIFYPSAGVFVSCYIAASGAKSVVPKEGSSELAYEILEGNPTGFFTVPAVVYSGQAAQVVFEGTALASGDSVEVVEGGDCWGAGGGGTRTTIFSGIAEPFEPPSALTAIPLPGSVAPSNLTLCYSVLDPANPTAPPSWTVVGGLGGLEVHPANPAGFATFPGVPRVRQKVTATVTPGVVFEAERKFPFGSPVKEGALTPADRVKIVDASLTCASPPAFGVRETAVTIGMAGEILWGALQESDEYVASFEPFSGIICYKINMHGASWVPIGGTAESGRFTMGVAHPESFSTLPSPPLIGGVFSISFLSGTPFGNSGEAKLVDDGAQCDAPALLNPTRVTAQLFRPVVFSENPNEFNVTVCYRLPEATFAALPEVMSLSQQPIRCADLSNPTTDELYTPASQGKPRFGQLIQVSLQLSSGPAEVSEVKFVEWSSGASCGEAAQPVTFYPTGALRWNAFLSDAAAPGLRLCWRGVSSGGTWVPACTFCENAPRFPECRLDISAANPSGFSASPSPVFTTQRFSLSLQGVGLSATDTVTLHTAADTGYACDTPAVASSTVQTGGTPGSVRADFSALPAGTFRVCYGVTTESGKVQLRDPLVVSNFTGCTPTPQIPGDVSPGDVGTNPMQVGVVHAQTRRRVQIRPEIHDPPAGFSKVTLDSSSVQLGLSSSPQCGEGNVVVYPTQPGGVHFVQETFAEWQAGTPVFACLRPDNGVWGTMCKISLRSGLTSESCLEQPTVLEGQHTTATPPSPGRLAMVPQSGSNPTSCGAVPNDAFSETQGDIPSVKLTPFTAGEYAMCFLSEGDISAGLDHTFSTQICNVTVGDRSPTEAVFSKACDSEGSRVEIDVVFPENHPLGIRPTAEDRYAVVASPGLCALYNGSDGDAISSLPDPLLARLPPLALQAGNWSVCYHISQGGWAFLNEVVIKGPNPASISVLPEQRRAGQLLTITFHPRGGAVLFPEVDVVRFVRSSEECRQPGGGSYEVVGNSTADTTEVQSAFAGSGDWFACYRLDDCPPAPLLMQVTPYHPTDCLMPASIRAGSVFQIQITSTATAIGGNGKAKLVPLTSPCTDAEPPAPGTEVMDAALTSFGADITVPFFVGTTIFQDSLYKVCYKLENEQYAHIGGKCLLRLRPRNPVRYTLGHTTVIARRRFNITFYGDELLQGDRAHLLRGDSPTACSNLGKQDGSLVSVVNATISWSDQLVYDAVPHTVCYYAQEGQAWVQLPEPISFGLPNPVRYEVVPAAYPSPLAGDVFSLYFHKASDDKDTAYADLQETDVLLLETTDSESHSYVPDRIINSGSTAVFEIGLRNKTYSVRYGSSLASARDPYDALYFADLLVHRNPYGFSLTKTGVPRARQRITLQMHGRGLVAPVEEPNDVPDPNEKSDLLKVVVENTTFADHDEQCRALTEETGIKQELVETATPLYAASDGSTQVDIILDLPGRYVVCYARKGNNIMVAIPFITTSCSTRCAMAQRPPLSVQTALSPPVILDKGTTVQTLEEVAVTVLFNATPGWMPRDYVVPVPAGVACGPHATRVANTSMVIPDTLAPTASFHVRFNQTGSFHFCYMSPQIGDNGQWTELVPPISVQRASPDGFALRSGTPRSGGSVVELQLTDAGKPWGGDPPREATLRRLFRSLARRGTAQQSDGVALSVVAGDLPTACKGSPPLPAWAKVVSQSGGAYGFSFANKSESHVSFCVTPAECPTRQGAAGNGGECTRYMGSIYLNPAGMRGFVYDESAKELMVHGEGLSSGDRVAVAKYGVGDCVSGGLEPAPTAEVSPTPKRVALDGSSATFDATVGVERLQVCYRMADQTTLAPVNNLQSTGTDDNSLQVEVILPTRANCTGSASGKVNTTLQGGYTVWLYRGSTPLGAGAGSTVDVVTARRPEGGTLVYATRWDAGYTRLVIADLSANAVGEYEVEARIELPDGSLLTAGCGVLDVAGDPSVGDTVSPPETPDTATPEPQLATLSPGTPSPTAEDDCSGGDICAYHIIILVCVVVFGLIIVLVAAVVLWRRDPTPDVVYPELTVVPSVKPAFHTSAYGTQHTLRSEGPYFTPTNAVYKDGESGMPRWDPLRSLRNGGGVTTPLTALHPKGSPGGGFPAPAPVPFVPEPPADGGSGGVGGGGSVGASGGHAVSGSMHTPGPVSELPAVVTPGRSSHGASDSLKGAKRGSSKSASKGKKAKSNSRGNGSEAKAGGSQKDSQVSHGEDGLSVPSTAALRGSVQVSEKGSLGTPTLSAKRMPSPARLPPTVAGSFESKSHDGAYVPPKSARPTVRSCEHNKNIEHCDKCVLRPTPERE